ncbi:AraC family transcriptional regulator [Spirosoma sp. KNUC1025]|uniref:AraC family transcriptional regulator n=1 Tax=Spirosoma sp. KNUC1025 TaxID=2894082 RepID=UPI00386F87BF|nr:helix-turn-helix transcriptional regulator [Spirosoma sp. KNUC1025]
MTDEFGGDISIERIHINSSPIADKASLSFFEEAKQSHRHDRHSFFVLESGTVHIDIDFQSYKIDSPTVIYMHPDQVHRTTAFDNVTVSSLAINNENLHPEYLKLLEEITPTKPLLLTNETFSILTETVSLCLKFSERKSEKLYHSLLKDSCNAWVALVLSQFLEQSKPADKLSRFESITKAFREMLEHQYATVKRPAGYAQKLNISTPYLNECVKSTTGYSVSHHIQQRVILEAKRLLYYSDKSVKEIATVLGYDDYPYFSRLFTKVTGMTALAFRNRNLD